MDALSVSAYLASVTALLAKYVVVTSLQGKVRFETRTFRWPEDAEAWRGIAAAGREDERIERAQAVLRNDGETQPFYLVFGAAWVALGAPGGLVAGAAGLYTLARIAHALFLLRPRQPLRNRAFVVGQLVLVAIVLDAMRRALAL